MIVITGDVVITDNAGKTHTISTDDMNIEIVETEQREMGEETTFEGEYEDNDNDFTIKVEVYEYPVGACNHVEVTVNGCTIVSHTIHGELTE